MRVHTEEVFFHGAGKDPEAVMALDFQPSSTDNVLRLATCGLDPIVRIWSVAPELAIAHLADLEGHAKPVNVVRWAPLGAPNELASGSDDGCVVFWQPAPPEKLAQNQTEPWHQVKRLALFADILDIAWSPDGVTLAVATEQKTTVLFERMSGHMITRFDGHTNRVQGCAFDPLDMHVASLGADRCLRVYTRKGMLENGRKRNEKDWYTQSVFKGVPEEEGQGPQPRILHEASYPYFFRRLTWSPDGAFLVVPGVAFNDACPYCTLLFHRTDLSSPAAALPLQEAPALAVRFAPQKGPLEDEGYEGWYARRQLFAVATPYEVAVYDTRSDTAVGFAQGLHHASQTDLAWSPDAKILAVASQDGYVSLIALDDIAADVVSDSESELEEEMPLPEDACPELREYAEQLRLALEAPKDPVTPFKEQEDDAPGEDAATPADRKSVV